MICRSDHTFARQKYEQRLGKEQFIALRFPRRSFVESVPTQTPGRLKDGADVKLDVM